LVTTERHAGAQQRHRNIFESKRLRLSVRALIPSQHVGRPLDTLLVPYFDIFLVPYKEPKYKIDPEAYQVPTLQDT
jgi:hypothetical protein